MIPPISNTTQTTYFNAVWKSYRSRSKVGMTNALVRDFQMDRTEAIKLVESWIEQQLIVPTATKDNHYELNQN